MSLACNSSVARSLLESLTISAAVISLSDGKLLKDLLKVRDGEREGRGNRDCSPWSNQPADTCITCTVLEWVRAFSWLTLLLQDQSTVTLALNWTNILPQASKVRQAHLHVIAAAGLGIQTQRMKTVWWPHI
jgi:hypothetical protein